MELLVSWGLLVSFGLLVFFWRCCRWFSCSRCCCCCRCFCCCCNCCCCWFCCCCCFCRCFCCCCCNCCCRWFCCCCCCCCLCWGLGLFLRRGFNWTFPPLFRGSPPLFGHFSPALLVIFGLDLTRALGLRFFGDGGGRCVFCCCRRLFLVFRSLGGKTLRYVRPVCTPSTWGRLPHEI